MKKTTSYINRYGDNIVFEEINENTIFMYGFNPEWMRYGYPNDYSEAYEVYCLGNQNPMTYQEFVFEVEHNFHSTNSPYEPFYKFIKSDKSCIDMVDPSGGPYIQIGTNIGLYFEDKKERRVQSISIEDNKVALYI